jgi:glycerophosphoryl diester phosphodiesterase
VGSLGSLGSAALVIAAVASMAEPSSTKQLIAHRGASGYAPEHTRAAYQLAIDQHADFVEQDLAVTKDRVLICLHDDTLERTTNARDVFPDRFTRESIIRTPGTHWIANDFTLDEIRTLDTGRWFGPRFAGSRIVTWQEAIDLVRAHPGVGMYPELKSPPLYTSRGIDMTALFVESVRRNGMDRPESLRTTPLIIQSFDEPTIRRLATALPTIPRVLLTSNAADLSDSRLREIASYASGIAPDKRLIADHREIVDRAHAAGMTVTAWTFRADEKTSFLSVRDEITYFLERLGIDALFTNNPDLFPGR